VTLAVPPVISVKFPTPEAGFGGGVRPAPLRLLDPRFARSRPFLLFCCLAALLNARSTRPADQPSAPFLQLRQTTLGYHGPSDDFTNLIEIRLGWFGPTNLDDPLTGDLWWAANFAIQEANAHGGCSWNSEPETQISKPPNLPFRLVPRWAVDPWGTGVSQLTRMVYDEQPLALIGSVDSASTHLAEQVVAKAQLPLVSPIATDKSVTLAGVSWMFSCAPSDDAIARVLVEEVLVTLGTSAVGSQGACALPGGADSPSARSRSGNPHGAGSVETQRSVGGMAERNPSMPRDLGGNSVALGRRPSLSPLTPALSPLRGEGARRGGTDQSMVSAAFEATSSEVERAAGPRDVPPGLSAPDGSPSPLNGERAGVRGENIEARNFLPGSTLVSTDLPPDANPPTSTTAPRKARLALLATTDHESRMTTREVLKQFSCRGRAPDFSFNVPPGAVDFASQLQAAVEAHPAVVLIVAGAEDSARLTRALRDQLGRVHIFGSPSMGRRRFLELAGPAAEGVRFPVLFVPEATDTNAARFIARFTTERQHPPDYTAALAYDATRLLIEAVRRAGPNRARIREALAQPSPWPGVAGPIQFDGTGQNTRITVVMGTLRDGVIVPPSCPNTSANAIKL
jgi:ABC-type branched-subunit amino acid transport system substrate-binding protein